jgi:hypothetical protein
MTPLISLAVSQDGGYVEVTDISTDKVSGSASILFWSTDFSSSANMDTSNPSSGIWNVPVSNRNIYNFFVGWIYAWVNTLDIEIQQYQIVEYNGIFFIKTTAGTINPSTQDTNPLLDATDFSPLVVGQSVTFEDERGLMSSLTSLDIYNIVYNSLVTQGLQIGQATGVINVNASPFTLDNPSCHEWHLTNNSTATIDSVSLLDYKGDLIRELSMMGTTCIISLDTDGVYKVLIEFNSGDSTILEITDLCQAKKCYLKLFKESLCDCPGCDKRDVQDKVNVIMNLIYCIETMTDMDDNPDLGLQIAKLNLIINRCGVCE